MLLYFSNRPLFGGAMSCEIPTTWKDVSDIRQVPDHQECFLDTSRTDEDDDGEDGALLVVEILQRQEHIPDSNAATFFFQDLAESNGISSAQDLQFYPMTIITTSNTTTTTTNDTTTNATTRRPAMILNSRIENAIPCAGVGYQKVGMGMRDYTVAGNHRQLLQTVRLVKIELCVFRLPSVDTDLLVTISKPVAGVNNPNDEHEHEPQHDDDFNNDSSSVSEIFQRVVSSLQIHDWGLFGNN